MTPFLKWVGGKRQILDQILALAPQQFANYYEPFVGGGAVVLALKPKNATIGDLNPELIAAYKAIKTDLKKLIEYIKLFEALHSESLFKKISFLDRIELESSFELPRSSNALRAARLIYLNKTAFNGLYRVNKAGHFNVPWNQKTQQKLVDYKNLTEISEWLNNSQITIKCQDYQKTVKTAGANDFVYFDPPYDYEDSKGFHAFTANGFDNLRQKELAQLCRALTSKGVLIMVSNHDTKLIRELYQGFNITPLNVRRAVGGKNARRGLVQEVLITNYDRAR